MNLHHDKHLQTYVDNLNAALANYPEYQNWTLERLILNANWLPEAIRTPVKHNAGGVYNHNFFFANMSPTAGRAPTGELEEKISQAFGGYDEFKKKFKAAALDVFGSGYAWLTADRDGNLKIIQTHNQDTPITSNLIPIMCIDVWEHAYYLKHYNKRTDYIDDWFAVANPDRASRNYAAATGK